MTVKQLSKFKKLKYEIITTLQWIDFVPLGEISQDKYKQHLFVTNKTMFCVFLDGNYFGIDLFQINEDEQNFNGWGYKLQLQKNFGSLFKKTFYFKRIIIDFFQIYVIFFAEQY